MPSKSWMYAVLEAVQYEMQQDPNMIWLIELTAPVASNPGMPVINLETEFGRKRVSNTVIDEMWMVAATLGAGLAGTRAATWPCASTTGSGTGIWRSPTRRSRVRSPWPATTRELAPRWTERDSWPLTSPRTRIASFSSATSRRFRSALALEEPMDATCASA